MFHLFQIPDLDGIKIFGTNNFCKNLEDFFCHFSLSYQKSHHCYYMALILCNNYPNVL